MLFTLVLREKLQNINLTYPEWNIHEEAQKLDLLCPISQVLMREPITIPSTGQTYDKKSLINQFQHGSFRDALTNQPLQMEEVSAINNSEIQVSYHCKKQISRFIEEKAAQYIEQFLKLNSVLALSANEKDEIKKILTTENDPYENNLAFNETMQLAMQESSEVVESPLPNENNLTFNETMQPAMQESPEAAESSFSIEVSSSIATASSQLSNSENTIIPLLPSRWSSRAFAEELPFFNVSAIFCFSVTALYEIVYWGSLRNHDLENVFDPSHDNIRAGIIQAYEACYPLDAGHYTELCSNTLDDMRDDERSSSWQVLILFATGTMCALLNEVKISENRAELRNPLQVNFRNMARDGFTSVLFLLPLLIQLAISYFISEESEQAEQVAVAFIYALDECISYNSFQEEGCIREAIETNESNFPEVPFMLALGLPLVIAFFHLYTKILSFYRLSPRPARRSETSSTTSPQGRFFNLATNHSALNSEAEENIELTTREAVALNALEAGNSVSTDDDSSSTEAEASLSM